MQQDKLHNLFAIDMGNENKDEITEQLMHQMSTVGFCLVKNIRNYDEKALFDASKAFHYDVPADAKEHMKLKHFNTANENISKGFFPFIANDPSHKEFYDMMRKLSTMPEEERRVCPLYEDAPWIPEEMDSEGKYKWIIN